MVIIKRIGYLGPEGTFSEIAARLYLRGRRAELVAYFSLLDVFEGVERGDTDEGILPLENSVEGPINLTMDLLARSVALQIQGEVILPVTHNLLARPELRMEDIKQIVSHPQPLAQCREFIRKYLPQAMLVEFSSTAAAACTVAQSTQPWAAIGTELAAKAHGLQILAGNINDYPENATRFVVVGREGCPLQAGCKTSLIVTLKDRPGALYYTLHEFAVRGINLTRIESRPTKSRIGDYLFFIDFVGHKDEKVIHEALQAVKAQAMTMHVLGSYPIGELADERQLVF